MSDEGLIRQSALWSVAIAKATELMTIFSFEAFFDAAASSIAELMDADGAALIVYETSELLRYKLFFGMEVLNQVSISRFRFPVKSGTVGRVLASGQKLFTPDYPGSPEAMPEFVAAGMRANLVVPLRGPTGFIGAIAIAWMSRPPPSPLHPENLAIVDLFASLIGSALYREALERQLESQALHDPLTGLPNRRMLMIRLAESMKRARRNGAVLALAVIDLDGFKAVNDHSGHMAGDEILISAAGRIQEHIRDTDFVARTGGDEFVVILENVRDGEEAKSILERVGHSVVLETGPDGPLSVKISASIGATIASPDQQEMEVLLRRADAAMYRSKKNGGNRVVLMEDMLAG
jgi:diguanylate cyclase (GGDEF)-like protein